MIHTIEEPIDLDNPMTVRAVIGFDPKKRKTFNQVMVKSFNSIKDRQVLNHLYNSMNDKVVEQNSSAGRLDSPTKDEQLIEFLDEKIFK